MKSKPKRRRKRAGRPDEEHNRESFLARAEAVLYREHGLRLRWVRVADVTGPWARVVAVVRKATAGWADAAADMMGAVPPERARAKWRWYTDDPAHGCPSLFAPRLHALAELRRKHAAFHELERALEAPNEPTLPRPPKTTAAARAWFLKANAAHVRTRTLIRRGGFLDRAGLQESVTRALGTFRARVWSLRGRLGGTAGDRARALELVSRAIRDDLAELATLGGLLEPATRPRRAR